jgi:hypothetical protein
MKIAAAESIWVESTGWTVGIFARTVLKVRSKKRNKIRCQANRIDLFGNRRLLKLVSTVPRIAHNSNKVCLTLVFDVLINRIYL